MPAEFDGRISASEEPSKLWPERLPTEHGTLWYLARLLVSEGSRAR